MKKHILYSATQSIKPAVPIGDSYDFLRAVPPTVAVSEDGLLLLVSGLIHVALWVASLVYDLLYVQKELDEDVDREEWAYWTLMVATSFASFAAVLSGFLAHSFSTGWKQCRSSDLFKSLDAKNWAHWPLYRTLVTGPLLASIVFNFMLARNASNIVSVTRGDEDSADAEKQFRYMTLSVLLLKICAYQMVIHNFQYVAPAATKASV
jgi:uncharacterized membrane protein